MAKYASATTSVKIRACYNSVPVQLAKENKKFQYKIVQRGGTATIFGESIEWLNFAGVVLKCQKVEHGYMPVAVYADLSDFKLYISDVGLLTALVVGNATYPNGNDLANPVNDAMDLGAKLKGYGFEVIVATDCTAKMMDSHLKAFRNNGKDLLCYC